MKNQTAVFNAKNKILFFMFRDESFTINLTEGDLHDNWNAITLKNREVFDFNFCWEEYSEPSVNLYATYYKGEELYTNHSESYDLEIIEQIGTFEDYFGEGTKLEESYFIGDFEDWHETHYEVVKHLVLNEDLFLDKIEDSERQDKGTGGIWVLAKDITNAFQEQYQDELWEEGDYYETLWDFIDEFKI
jgi:hypothetical protein